MGENIINVQYEATGNSTMVNEMGMREMQARAYASRNAQYLLLKAPPASGKSRALMFIALDKLKSGQISKVVVAVPERSIGGSFKTTKLTDYGFCFGQFLGIKFKNSGVYTLDFALCF